MWQYAMGWREIFTRILGDFAVEENVTPPWLRNPNTKRLLKLDLYYPDVGVAVRLQGLQGQRKARKSDQEEIEEAQRDELREELCRQHGVRLINVDLGAGEPRAVFNELSRALATASRVVAQGDSGRVDKGRLMPNLAQARQTLERVRMQVRRAEDVALYADAWRDREMAAIAAVQAEAKPTSARGGTAFKSGRIIATVYKPGAEVKHERFGRGTVVATQLDGDDMAITISFVTAGERKFLVSLVQDKLTLM
jgi:hypothetical protein